VGAACFRAAFAGAAFAGAAFVPAARPFGAAGALSVVSTPTDVAPSPEAVLDALLRWVG
jgi:hypothetical protein